MKRWRKPFLTGGASVENGRPHSVLQRLLRAADLLLILNSLTGVWRFMTQRCDSSPMSLRRTRLLRKVLDQFSEDTKEARFLFNLDVESCLRTLGSGMPRSAKAGRISVCS